MAQGRPLLERLRDRLAGARDRSPLADRAVGTVDRYLDVQQDVLETFVDRGQLERLRQPTISPTGRRTRWGWAPPPCAGFRSTTGCGW